MRRFVRLGVPNLQSTLAPQSAHDLADSVERGRVAQLRQLIGKVGNDNNDPNPLLHFVTEGAYDFKTNQLPNFSYFDLALNWRTPLKGLEIRGGVNNMFDKDPPIVVTPAYYGAGYANTAPAYDTLGRQLYVAFTATF